MNKIAFTARTVKGLSEADVARKLEISESSYRELELEITHISSEIAKKLENLYNVPAVYFMISGYYNIQLGIDALEDQKKIISNMTESECLSISVTAKTHMSIGRLGMEALIARQEALLLSRQNIELKFENDLLRELYNSERNS